MFGPGERLLPGEPGPCWPECSWASRTEGARFRAGAPRVAVRRHDHGGSECSAGATASADRSCHRHESHNFRHNDTEHTTAPANCSTRGACLCFASRPRRGIVWRGTFTTRFISSIPTTALTWASRHRGCGSTSARSRRANASCRPCFSISWCAGPAAMCGSIGRTLDQRPPDQFPHPRLETISYNINRAYNGFYDDCAA